MTSLICDTTPTIEVLFMWLQCNRRSRYLTCSLARLWSWQAGTCPHGQILHGPLPPDETGPRWRILTAILFTHIICSAVIQINNTVSIGNNIEIIIVSDLADKIMKILLSGEAAKRIDDCADLPAKQTFKKKKIDIR